MIMPDYYIWNEYEQLICPFCHKLAHPKPCKQELAASVSQ
jgi:hypothetical protein